MNNGIETLIYKYNAKVYEHYKKFIPCFNGKCLVSTMCCEEKKASRGAKHLAYRIRLKNPCEEARDIFLAIKTMPELSERVELHKKKSNVHFKIHEILEEQLKIFKSKFKMLEMNKKVEFGSPYSAILEHEDELYQLFCDWVGLFRDT